MRLIDIDATAEVAVGEGYEIAVENWPEDISEYKVELVADTIARIVLADCMNILLAEGANKHY